MSLPLDELVRATMATRVPTSQAECDIVSARRFDLNVAKIEIDKWRKATLAPVLIEQRRINTRAGDILKPITGAIAHADALRATYRDVVEQARRDACEIATPPPPAHDEVPDMTVLAGMADIPDAVFRTREHETVEVYDADLIPREFLTIDMVALRAAILKDNRTIPGARRLVEHRPA